MVSYVTPKKNSAFILYFALPSMAATGSFQSAPTLAAGDFKVSIDGGALANLTTLPTNTPGGVMVKASFSASEMNGDNITLVAIDQTATKEWADTVINIQTSARQIDDLATQTSVDTIDDFLDTEVAAITTAVADVPTNAELSTALSPISSNVDHVVTVIDSGQLDKPTTQPSGPTPPDRTGIVSSPRPRGTEL